MMTPTKFASLACPQTLAAALGITDQDIAAMWAMPLEERRSLPWYKKWLKAEHARVQAKHRALSPEVYAHVDAQKSHEDNFWAGVLAPMTDEQIAYRITQINIEIYGLPYRALSVNIADRRAGLVDERTRMRAEQKARAICREIDEASIVEAVARALEVEAAA